MQFSQEIIEERKEVFREDNGIEFSDEQANEALINLSSLYIAFSKHRLNGVIEGGRSR